MVSADFYEGIRPAAAGDLDAVAQLLKPLEDKGVLVHRSPEQLRAELPFFTVFEQVGGRHLLRVVQRCDAAVCVHLQQQHMHQRRPPSTVVTEWGGAGVCAGQAAGGGC